MKNLNFFAGLVGTLSVLLISCEPEDIIAEDVSPVSELNLSSSIENIDIQEENNLYCTTVSANNWPDGLVPGDFTEGVTITTSNPNAYVRTYQMASWFNCYNLTKSLSTSVDGPYFIFSFDEEVVSFSVRVNGVSFQMDNIYVTAYDDLEGAGNVVTTVHYPVTSNVCSEISVEGNGIRSIIVSSDGEETNSVNIGGFSFCTNPDLDGDGFIDDVDNCPQLANSDQADFDQDGIGDLCDSDDDNDGIADEEDNCPLISNSSQEDNDNDDIGDFCDPDDDNDGVADEEDICPSIVNPLQEDYDGDGEGDNCDQDDDNDGVLDENDSVNFSNKELTLTIGDCNSGVLNAQLNDGIYMADLVDEVETGNYKNLGQTVRSYNDLLNDWVQKELISGEEKSLILNCAISENQ